MMIHDQSREHLYSYTLIGQSPDKRICCALFSDGPPEIGLSYSPSYKLYIAWQTAPCRGYDQLSKFIEVNVNLKY